MNITVRLADAEDADAVAEAHTAAWRIGYRGLISDTYLDDDRHATLRLERWRRRLREGPPAGGDRLNEIFVAELDGCVVGFGHAGREYLESGESSTRGEVYGFYLHPDAWGSGAADPMMAACLASLRSRFGEAVLWVLRDNPRARRFYERTGWSCGTGDQFVEQDWELPPLSDTATVDHPPVREVQYRIRFG